MMPSPCNVTPLRIAHEFAALDELCALAVALVAEAKPGDAVYRASPGEIIAGVDAVLVLLPRIHDPFVVGARIVVGGKR